MDKTQVSQVLGIRDILSSSQLEKRFNYTAKEDTLISYACLGSIEAVLEEELKRVGAKNSLKYTAYYVEDDWMTRKGTYPKRLASALKKAHVTLPAKVISQIGEIARRSTDNGVFECDFTNRIDWQSGDFGDEGSCFWISATAALDLISENGYAFRAWRYAEDGTAYGIARCWVAPDFPRKGVLTAFNFYGWSHKLMVKRIFRWLENVYRERNIATEIDAKWVYLTNNGRHGDLLYINDDEAVAVGPTSELNRVDGEKTYDLEWKFKENET